MFYLYVRIYSRSQLMVLEPEFMKGLNVKLRDINNVGGGAPCLGLEGLFRYAALYRETLIKAIDAAVQCRSFLEENREFLDGYNIILSQCDTRDYDLPKAMEYLVYQILEDGGIWVDPDCAEAMGELLYLEKESRLYRMTGRKQSEPSPGERYAHLLSNSSVQNGIIRWIEEKKDSLLVLQGDEGSGRAMNLDRALEIYLGRDSGTVLRLRLNGGRDFIYDPFIDCLAAEKGNMFSGSRDFLSDLLQGKMLRRCSDFFSDDFEEAFLEFLEEKKRGADLKSQILSIIIEEGEDYSSLSRRLLARILTLTGFRFFIVSTRVIPSFIPDGLSYSVIDLPRLNRDECRDRLAKAYPGTEWSGEKMELLERATSLNPEKLFFASWLMEKAGRLEMERDVRFQLIDWLEGEERILFQYILLGQGLLRRDVLIRHFSPRDGESLVLERINRLISLQLVRRNGKDELSSEIGSYPLEGELREKIVKSVIELIRGEENVRTFRYFDFLEKQNAYQEALAYLKDIMTWLINNGFRMEAERLIAYPPFAGKDMDSASLETLQNLLFSNRLRMALQEKDGKILSDLVSGGLLSQVSERGEYAEDFFLQLARYYYTQGHMEQTVNYAKNALYLFQKKGNHLGEGLANMELAFAFLGQRKVQMGMDYFEIARRVSYQIEDNYTLISAQTFSALTAFLFGNISKAEDMIGQTLELARINGCRRRIFFLTFMAGRIQFEYGRYREGAELFEECWQLAEKIGLDEGRDTAKRWIGRCLLYQDKRRDAFRWLDPEDRTREGLFILAEADFMVSLYESALRRLETALETAHMLPLSYSERENWCDGFMPIEGRLSSEEKKEDVLTRQIETLYSHILALTGRHDEASRFFTRGSVQDDYPFKPYSYKYNYIYFTILNVGDITANGDDHRLAALSKAIERLQSRAGRFDNQHKKLDFLNRNWWNKRIMEEAHKKKFF